MPHEIIYFNKSRKISTGGSAPRQQIIVRPSMIEFIYGHMFDSNDKLKLEVKLKNKVTRVYITASIFKNTPKVRNYIEEYV